MIPAPKIVSSAAAAAGCIQHGSNIGAGVGVQSPGKHLPAAAAELAPRFSVSCRRGQSTKTDGGEEGEEERRERHRTRFQ